MPTGQPAAAPSATPAPTESPTSTPVPTQTAAAPAAAPTSAADCPASAKSRLTAGTNAKILTNLNMRSEPAIAKNIITTNPARAVLKLLQGPVCVPYQGGAYLWWQVQTADGKTGWSAENFLNGNGYFLEPAP